MSLDFLGTTSSLVDKTFRVGLGQAGLGIEFSSKSFSRLNNAKWIEDDDGSLSCHGIIARTDLLY
jgi:hypothetical protein